MILHAYSRKIEYIYTPEVEAEEKGYYIENYMKWYYTELFFNLKCIVLIMMCSST